MSVPISAMIVCAAVRPTTDLIQPLDRRPKRGDLRLDLAVQVGDVGAGLVEAATMPPPERRPPSRP
jgi:hypothetical protein